MSLRFGWRTSKPTARTAELLVEELGDELLVYDQRDDQVHCLSSAAGRVWRACDGLTSVEQLGGVLGLESGVVDQALGELEGCGLLEGEAGDGVTRREATGRLAKLGAAAAAAPLVYSIAAPTPALAASQRFCQTVVNCVGTANKGQVGCGATCGANGCACCYTSPAMCNAPSNGVPGNNVYVRCTAACSPAAANVCSHQYVGAGNGVCANFLPANCSNFNACVSNVGTF